VKGKTDTKGYNIPVGAHLAVDAGEKIKAGQVLAKIPARWVSQEILPVVFPV
jgi:DNA-directed RNA polymerase subunit beta'